MRIEQLKIYQIKELSKEAQQEAIEQYRNMNKDYLYFFQDDCIEQLKDKFWDDVRLQYSLSYCQGDGLSFSGKLDLKKFLENVYSVKLPKYKIWAIDEYIYKVHSKGNTGHYCYSADNQIECDYNYYDNKRRKNLDKLWDNILSEIKEYYMTICKDLEKQGYAQLDYENSDEYIIEHFEANEYEFLENGKIYR